MTIAEVLAAFDGTEVSTEQAEEWLLAIRWREDPASQGNAITRWLPPDVTIRPDLVIQWPAQTTYLSALQRVAVREAVRRWWVALSE